MTPEQAYEAIHQINAQFGWKIYVIDRDEVAARWYPEAGDPVITDEQWAAIKATEAWTDLDPKEEAWEILMATVDEGIQEVLDAFLEKESDLGVDL